MHGGNGECRSRPGLPFDCPAQDNEPLFVHIASLVAEVNAAVRGEAGGARVESYV